MLHKKEITTLSFSYSGPTLLPSLKKIRSVELFI